MIDKEKLLEWNPDYLFIDQGGFRVGPVEDYQKESCSFTNRFRPFRMAIVHTQLPYNYYSTNIDTAIADAYYLGKVLYPDAFADVDPAAKADEIYEGLLGEAVYDQMVATFAEFGPVQLSEN